MHKKQSTRKKITKMEPVKSRLGSPGIVTSHSRRRLVVPQEQPKQLCSELKDVAHVMYKSVVIMVEYVETCYDALIIPEVREFRSFLFYKQEVGYFFCKVVTLALFWCELVQVASGQFLFLSCVHQDSDIVIGDNEDSGVGCRSQESAASANPAIRPELHPRYLRPPSVSPAAGHRRQASD